jgi:hypothetical protein
MLTVERGDELATLEVGKREVRLTKYPGISLFEQRGGRGPIRFGPPIRISDGQYRSTLIPSLDPRPHLLAIDDARNVFELIKRLGLISAQSIDDESERHLDAGA